MWNWIKRTVAACVQEEPGHAEIEGLVDVLDLTEIITDDDMDLAHTA